MSAEHPYLTIRQAAGLLARREVSPVELAQAHLERIGRLQPSLHAFLTVTAERALADARAAEDALKRGEGGPLLGIPIALKDLFCTAGIRTTAHSRVLANHVPAEDATVVARLRKAGTVLLGKLAMHEFATAGPASELAPAARNPWNTGYIPGGSSSGSGAAVAAGLCLAALGTDTGGSIRQPSSFGGIVGLKPTYGRVSRHGVIPLCWSLDHVGPIARTVEDAALVLQALAGPDPLDPTTSTNAVPDYPAALTGDVRGLRVGLPDYFFGPEGGADREVLDAVHQAARALEGLGARVVEVAIPGLRAARPAHSVIHGVEAYAYHAANLHRQRQNYGPRLRQRLLVGALFSGADYARALRFRAAFRAELARIFEQVDLLATPTNPVTALPFEGLDPRRQSRAHSFTGPFNLAGLPAVSVPCGFSPAALPIGLQLVGRPFEEATVLRAAHAYEQHAGWYQRHPPVE